MKNQQPTVVIFDSGVGGLSIYQQIKATLSTNANYIFVSDNAAYPYGEKSEAFLKQRVSDVVQRIYEQFNPDVLVIACNTASTIVLPILRANYAFDIVGVVPAIKPACQLSKTKHIGVLATPGTVKRQYTQDLIQEFAVDCKVTLVGSTELVEMAERKLYRQSIEKQQHAGELQSVLSSVLQPIINDPMIDIVVLACTHFPLLNHEFVEFFKASSHSLQLIDSGQAIALRVQNLLNAKHTQETAIKNQQTIAISSKAFFTNSIEEQTQFISNLSKLGLSYQGTL